MEIIRTVGDKISSLKLSRCGDNDFEVLRALGYKLLSAITVRTGFVWDAAAIKAAAGQGAVYVRLTQNFEPCTSSSTLENELQPAIKFKIQDDPSSEIIITDDTAENDDTFPPMVTSNVERVNSSRLSGVDCCVASEPTTVQMQLGDGSRFGAPDSTKCAKTLL